ncbi:MAG TPA: HEAT repeat domain-containing protein, partial [Armatimonadota bacterium]|nr:HEAT repeat domain-containing protein [Armatimonadota bacterium]
MDEIARRVETLGRLDRGRQREAREALAALGPAAVPALCEALRSGEPGVRRQAAELLGEIGDRSAAGALAACFRDADSEVRQKAAEALGLLADPATLPALREALRDEDAAV